MSNCSIRHFISSSSPSSPSSSPPPPRPRSDESPEEMPISKSTIGPTSPSSSTSKDALVLLTLFQIPTALLTFGLTAGSFYVFSKSKRARALTPVVSKTSHDVIARSEEVFRQALLRRLERLETLSIENQQWARQLGGKLERNAAQPVEVIGSSPKQIRRILIKDHDRFRSSLNRIERVLEQLPQTSFANQMTKTSSQGSSPPSSDITASTEKHVSEPVTSKESVWEAARDSSPFLYGQHPPAESIKPSVDLTINNQSPKGDLKYTSAFRPTVQSSDKTPGKADIAQWSSLFNQKKQERAAKALGARTKIKKAKREAEQEEDRVTQEEKEWKAQKRGWTKDSEPTEKSFVLINTDESSKTAVSGDPIVAKPGHSASDFIRADDTHHDGLLKRTISEAKPSESKEAYVVKAAQPKSSEASESDPLPIRQTKDRQPWVLDRPSPSQTSQSQAPRSDSFTNSASSSDGASTATQSKAKSATTNADAFTPSATRPYFSFGFHPHSMVSAFSLHFGKLCKPKHGCTHPFIRAETAGKTRESDRAREHEGVPLGEVKVHGQGSSYWTMINGVRVKRVSSWR